MSRSKKTQKPLYRYPFTVPRTGRPDAFYHTDDIKYVALTHNAVDPRDRICRVLAWGTDKDAVIREAKQTFLRPASRRDTDLSPNFEIVEVTEPRELV